MLILSMEKIILTDCDGVLLNWEYAFGTWMEEHGHTMIENGNFIYNIGKRFDIDKNEASKLIRFFNESATIGFLPALRDAEHYVKLLGNLGYRFHVITSLSKDPNAQRLRTKNLTKLFGNVFEKFIYLDTGEDKDAILAHYKDSDLLWVEDKPANAEVGLRCGLNSIVMEHAFNLHYEGDAPFVKNWAEIYTMVTGISANDSVDIA
jgi:FMN phosphatase YigB (HAD superfamily)